MATVVTATTVAQLQTQYGTLRAAVETYLNGDMPVQQQAALENIVNPGFIAAIAQTRLFNAIVRLLGE